ncbi:MAG: CoA transferase [Deltaproteobacteria bacterium]|nr:CoA transferase [Deltaproteobacteria bacterium]
MEKALKDIHILDFSWVIAGPLATKMLANMGATVVRVEHHGNVDLMRQYPPFAEGVQGVNRSGTFAKYNDGKRGMMLNLKHPKAAHVVKRLVEWADVVVENFSPGTMERRHMGYDDLIKINPRIIMIRSSLVGQTGPYAGHPGFGTMLQAYSGFTSSMHWPDRMPAGSNVPWTDYPAAGFMALAILAALDYRDKNGRGVYIDLSQLEAAQQFLIPALLDAVANGRSLEPTGNRHPAACPHGVYACLGEDRWCSISVFNDEQWEAFKAVMDHPEWSRTERFSTLADRKDHEDEIDRHIRLWTSGQKAADLMNKLQKAGIPAGVVSDGRDLALDPQLAHRAHFVELEHPEIGPSSYHAPPFRLSLTPHQVDMAAPCMGQHTEFVCRRILGLSEQAYQGFVSEGVFS